MDCYLIFIYVLLFQLCEYEKKRMGKVLENKKKVEALGLKKLADGLNLKVIKEKVKDDDEHESDVEYVPENKSVSDDEQDNEEIKEKEAAKKNK